VALSLPRRLQKLAKALHIFCKIKDVAAPHFYKFFSLHGLIKGSHHSSLLSCPPS
jgi:hypothetical protein